MLEMSAGWGMRSMRTLPPAPCEWLPTLIWKTQEAKDQARYRKAQSDAKHPYPLRGVMNPESISVQVQLQFKSLGLVRYFLCIWV